MEQIRRMTDQCPAFSSFGMQMSYVEIHRDSPENQYDSHVHPECEIYINLSGDVSFMVEKRIYPILPGSIIITRPYEYHHCVYHTNALHKHFWILFSAEGNEAILPIFFNRPLGEGNLLTLQPKEQQELIALCHTMIQRKAMPAERFYQFFQMLHLLDSAQVVAPNADSYPPDVAMTLEQINCRFAEPISIGELANAAHVSINTLERHFAELLHMSPTAYLRKKRLAHAAETLYEGGSVMDACVGSGFSDYSNFIALFKRTYGITPLKYQKQVRGRDVKGDF